MRRLSFLLLLPLLMALGGCVAYPAGPGYYGPPAASVYVAPRVAPRPYYYRPYGYGYAPRPYGYGWRRW